MGSMGAVLLLIHSEKEREELRRRMELRRSKEKKTVSFSNSRLFVEEASSFHRKKGKAGKEGSIRFLSRCFFVYFLLFSNILSSIFLSDCQFLSMHGLKMIAQIFCS